MMTKKQSQWPVNIGMKGTEIVNKVKVDQPIYEFYEIGDLSITGYPVSPPNPPTIKPRPIRPEDYLIKLTKKEEAFGPKLEAVCLTQGITLVEGFARTIGLNLQLFNSKTLAKTNPRQRIEVRSQVKQSGGPTDWSSKSDKGSMTINEYYKYQEDPSRSTSQTGDNVNKIKFATNIDLSDAKWATQLKELAKKLPEFLRVDKGMLSYIDHNILGMNTVQLYMKVPGCRTPGHQENLGVCSVNINTGPGDCQWFAVPSAYWGVVYHLCKKQGLNYLEDAWWPLLKDLEEEGVPVYRFVQRCGDLVFVGFNCVHWVEALGVCNNVAWNVGPISGTQYRVAIERYEWNKTQKFKSLVPMMNLTVMLAQKVEITDPKLYKRIKKTLMRILIQHVKTQEFLAGCRVDITRDERTEDDRPSYCDECRAEIFGLVLVHDPCPVDPSVQLIPACLPCAVKKSPRLDGFDCREQYTLNELIDIYDGFAQGTGNFLSDPPAKKSRPPSAPSSASSSKGTQEE